jgi:hypothetical protein
MANNDQKKAFQEWKADYAARRDENRRENTSTAGPPETWPSEIAKANREKQKEQDQGKSSANEKTMGHDAGHSM